MGDICKTGSIRCWKRSHGISDNHDIAGYRHPPTLHLWACAAIPLAPMEIAAVLKKAPKLHYTALLHLMMFWTTTSEFSDFLDPKNALILPHRLKLLFSCTVVNVPSAAIIHMREIAQ